MAADKKSYMREYRKLYRQTPKGRAKILANRKRWKKSNRGKQRAREYSKRKYVPSSRVLKTSEQLRDTRIKYWKATAGPKRIRRHREEMWHLKRYGLTKEQYLEMLAAQGGGCAICGSTNGSNKNPKVLCVDHCHDSGKVRGLLCDACNRGIGCLKDDPGIVRKALLYLEASDE